MSSRDRAYLTDGFADLSKGIDSGRIPSLLRRDQLSFLVNGTVRGGFVQCRPGQKKIPITFTSDDVMTLFQDGFFQGAHDYDPPNGEPILLASIGGRDFRINVSTNNLVEDITVTATPAQRQVWWEQAEDWAIKQDGQSRPRIYNGATLRETALIGELPVGRQMVYAKGRVWVADGRHYMAGDIMGSPSGDRSLGYRDAVLKVTENTFLNEGGSFGVPNMSGDITALNVIAVPDTSLGQGDIIVSTEGSMFTNLAPTDRKTWKQLTTPLQTMVLLKYGAASQNSLILVNGDLFFRAQDGVRSLIMAVREFTNWGNTPVSREAVRVFGRDDRTLLNWGSSVLFDNRVLFTASPYWTDHGVCHKAFGVLDFDVLSSITEKFPPVWEGMWTGLNILQVLKCTIRGAERCFIFALNGQNQIELWEQTRDERFDNGSNRITWSFETGAYAFSTVMRKRLQGATFWQDRIAGQVDFDLKWKPDQYPCWVDWTTWEECASIDNCETDEECLTLANWSEQYRPEVEVAQPVISDESGQNKISRDFYEVQVRLQVTGFARIKLMKLYASAQEKVTGPLV